MEIDERRVAAAGKFLDNNDHIIHKVTRAGFTTSFVIAAARSGKRVLLVSPTKRIIGDTMKGAVADIVRIYGNSACKWNQDEIAKEPLLKHLPMSIPKKCNKCKHAVDCCILDIERNPDAPMKSITAAKLEAIMVSDGARANELRTILEDIDVVLFDESHMLVVNDVPKVRHDAHMLYLKEKIANFPLLSNAVRKWNRLRQDAEPEEDELWRQVDHDTDDWLIREVRVPLQLSSIEKFGIWSELRKLAKKHEELGVTEEEVLQLRDIALILCNDTARLSYITNDDQGTIYICGAIGRMNTAVRDYLRNCAKNASAIFVSGTQFEPYPNYFIDVVGRDKSLNVAIQIEQSTFPDFLDTNRKMTIYADTFRLSGNTQQKHKKIPDIISRIKLISEEKNNSLIHVLAPNIELRERLYMSLHKEYPNLFFDYYRSENTIGVESRFRTIIAIGLAEVPKNSYDCLANSFAESQTIRVGSVDSATWQGWSRAKDPKGAMPSEVYCIGVKANDVARVLTWGLGRVVVWTGPNKFHVTCDDELPKPHIMAPFRQQVHKSQRKASPYIKRVWDSAGDLTGLPDSLKAYDIEISSIELSKSAYMYIRENGEKNAPNSRTVRCFGAIFANPKSSAEFEITAETLDRFFRSNQSQHAEQQQYPNREGRHPYYPHNTTIWNDLVMEMLSGIRTPATYGLGADGTTVQCCFDFDNHTGKIPALPRVQVAKAHLESLGIQPVVVASGSPDSYHLHIPVLRTPIKTSHEFVGTVLSELKQGHKDLDWHDTEAFPKQKNNRKALGNALKLPLAVNNKTGKRAEILGEDMQPVDVIFITRVVELQDPMEVAEKVGKRMYLPARVPVTPIASKPCTSGTSMRPCILAALNIQLNGSEGNDMRVAVVCEAFDSGKSRDEIIKMFERQNDYDESVTAKGVDYIISRGYKPWKCETIQAKCGSIIDCSQCPYNLIMAEVLESPEVTPESILARCCVG